MRTGQECESIYHIFPYYSGDYSQVFAIEIEIDEIRPLVSLTEEIKILSPPDPNGYEAPSPDSLVYFRPPENTEQKYFASETVCPF